MSTTTEPWLVSARHRSTLALSPAVPFGPWHARLAGQPNTACGLPAAGWPIFWHLTLVQGRERTCAECQRIVYLSRDA